MSLTTSHTLINPINGNLAFKMAYLVDAGNFDHIQRNNYYTLLWIKQGEGKVKVDFSEYEIGADYLFAFSPYQPFMLTGSNLAMQVIHFHPDFFCIHKHHAQVACNGVLFNNIYQPPFVILNEQSKHTLEMAVAELRAEVQNPALAQHELLVSYLKIILITSSRLKAEQHAQANVQAGDSREPFILQSLKEAIERDFKTKHTPSDYAATLNISPKALARITKNHFNKTLTDLIAERIIIEAKRELYLTNKTVKEIAYELGYQDEYYFSRFFKTNADVSPQLYRETVGVGRGM
jgi:AraC-like DNA-binding protein